MKSILAMLRGLLPKFKPTIKKFVQAELDRRQEGDINTILKVVDKYDHGLSGEQLDDLLVRLHDCMETIILTKIDKL